MIKKYFIFIFYEVKVELKKMYIPFENNKYNKP